jgi:hypothetical protein
VGLYQYLNNYSTLPAKVLKLSAVSRGESSILKEQYYLVFARYRIQYQNKWGVILLRWGIMPHIVSLKMPLQESNVFFPFIFNELVDIRNNFSAGILVALRLHEILRRS